MPDLREEEDFFDQKGLEILKEQESLVVDDPHSFLAGSSVAFNHTMKLVGDVAGSRVLDYGCGSGWLAVYLAKKGGEVYGFDISSKLIEVGIKRAEVNGVAEKVKLQKMTAEKLYYPDEFFDTVIGISILHHIDLGREMEELSRIMKKEAKAVFIEPFGENILLNFIRDFIERRIRGKRTQSEHPLRYKDLEKLRSYFNNVMHTEFQLFGMLERFIGHKVAKFLRLDNIDSRLLNKFPFLKRFCRIIVIYLIK